jgi:hypothetical protein
MGRNLASRAFLILIGWVAFAFSTGVQAGIKPCCVGGSDPGKFCADDSACPDACVGGARDGKPCASAGCPAACIGGRRPGGACEAETADKDCPGFCDPEAGGATAGATCFSDADCQGAACLEHGNCGPPGTCANDGSCTGQCQSKGKGPKRSPSDPVVAGGGGQAVEEELREPVCSE